MVEGPLTIAEIFDRALTLCIARWRNLVALSVLAAVPYTLLRAFNHGDMPRGAPAFVGSTVFDLLVDALCSAAIVRAIGDPSAPSSTGCLLREARVDYLRSVGSFLLIILLFYVTMIVAGVATLLGYGIGFAIGGIPWGVVAAVFVGLPALALLVPFLAVLAISYPVTILERVAPWRAIAIAASRLLRTGMIRSWLLSAALVTVAWVAVFAVQVAVDQGARLLHLRWLAMLTPLVDRLTAGCYGSALAVVIALDYRHRREGSDLLEALQRESPL